MSHTTTINDIVFSDIEALKGAVAALNKEGIKCSLIPDAVPRAYYANQLAKAGHVLKLENSRYDVGFYYDKAKKGFTAMADFFAGEIERQIGAHTVKGESDSQRAMGKLYNRYIVAATTRQAIKQGYQVRTINKPNGAVQLVVSGMKGN